MSAKKTGKKHAIITFVVLIAVIGIYVLVSQFSNIAKSVTEKIASETLKTPVRIARMDIDLAKLSIELGGISIKTPAGHGFEKPHVLTIDRILVDGDSFENNLLKFDEIAVSGLDLYFEGQADKTNIGVLKENLNASSPSKTSTDNSSASEPKEPIKVVIKKLNIEQGTLHPSVLLIDNVVDSVPLPSLKLYGVGEKTNGVLASEALSQVFNALLSSASKVGLSSGFFKGISASFGNTDAIKTKAKDLKNNIKGLFGN